MAIDFDKLSFEALRAKRQAEEDMTQKITKGIVDKWAVVGEGEELNADNVRKKFKELTHPKPDASGKIPKYTKMQDGTLIPSEDTMWEHGNSAASSLDKGMGTGFEKLMTMLMTAISAFFDWMGGGSKSFTEAYAKITTQNISSSYEQELAAMSQDPEHAEFIRQNDLANKGRETIAQAVNEKAGLIPASTEPVFDLDSYLANPQTRPKEAAPLALADAKGSNPSEKIDSITQQVIGKLETDYGKIIEGLDPAQQKTLGDLKTQLAVNVKALSTDAEAMKSPEAFSKRVIDKTCEDCHISPEQREQAAPLLKSLEASLKTAQPYIAAEVTGKPLSEDKKAELAKDMQKDNGAAQVASDIASQVKTTVSAKASEGIKDAAAKAVADKAINGSYIDYKAWGTYTKVGNEAKVIEKYKDKAPATKQETIALSVAKDKAYKVAADYESAPNKAQRKIISDMVGDAVVDALKNPKGELAANVQSAIEKKLTAQQGEIGQYGASVATLNENSGRDLIKEIAAGVAQTIRSDKKIAAQLANAQPILQEAHMKDALANKPKNNGAADKHTSLPSGHFVPSPAALPALGKNGQETVIS